MAKVLELTRLRFLVACCLSFLLSSCAHTQYQPHGPNGGYSEVKTSEDSYVTRFVGNNYTTRDEAALLSLFRAIEVCFERNKQVARAVDTTEHSLSNTVRKSSSYGYTTPQTFSANTNAFGGVSGTTSGGNSFGTTQSWDETYIYPVFDTIVQCRDTTHLLQLQFKELSADEAKPLVKDLMGAMQVISIPEPSVNSGTITIGDIFTKVNGVRVRTLAEVVSAVDQAPKKESIRVKLVREGRELSLNVKAVDATELLQSKAKEIIRQACKRSDVVRRPICNSQK